MTSTVGRSLETRVRQAIEAANGGDISQMEALVSEDAVLRAYCEGPMGGVHRGRNACFSNFSNLSALIGGTVRLETGEMTVAGPFVVMYDRATGVRDRELLDGTRDRADLDEPLCVIWRFADGKCVEFFDHFYNQAAWDAFWRFQDYTALRTRPTSSTLTRDEIRETVERIARDGDNGVLRDFFAPDILSYNDGTSPIGGRKSGIDELLAGFPQLYALSNGSLHIKNERVLVDEHFATIINRVSATRPGRSINQALCVTWRIEDDKVRNTWLHFEDVAAWDRFWAE